MNIKEKMLADVREFRVAFDKGVSAKKLSDEEKALHDSLLTEEMSELTNAKAAIEKLDAIVDVCYVLMGRYAHCPSEYLNADLLIDTLISVADTSGYDFVGAWNEVHKSNMTKKSLTLKDAFASRDQLYFDGYKNIEVITRLGGYELQNNEDVTLRCGKFVKKGKTLKGIYYTPARLDTFI